LSPGFQKKKYTKKSGAKWLTVLLFRRTAATRERGKGHNEKCLLKRIKWEV